MNRQDKLSYGVVVAAAALLLQFIGGIIAGVWIVSQISATTTQLQSSIGNLTHAVSDLNETVVTMRATQSNHDARLHVLELQK